MVAARLMPVLTTRGIDVFVTDTTVNGDIFRTVLGRATTI